MARSSGQWPLTTFLLGKNIRRKPNRQELALLPPLGHTMWVWTVAVLTMGFVGKSPWGYEVNAAGL